MRVGVVVAVAEAKAVIVVVVVVVVQQQQVLLVLVMNSFCADSGCDYDWALVVTGIRVGSRILKPGQAVASSAGTAQLPRVRHGRLELRTLGLREGRSMASRPQPLRRDCASGISDSTLFFVSAAEAQLRAIYHWILRRGLCRHCPGFT